MKTTRTHKPKARKPRPFTEYTYTDGTVEVMAHIDSKTGEIFHVYTYARDVDDLSGHEGPNGKPLPNWRWEKGINPIFCHLPARQVRAFVAAFIDSGELVCTEPETE